MITNHEFLDKICKRFHSKAEAKRAICDRLNVKPDTVHKWVYGKRGIPVYRYPDLISAFDIVGSDVFHVKPDSVSFHYLFLAGDDLDMYKKYLADLADTLEEIAQLSTSSMTINADEIPFFHLMSYKKLTYFKLYCYRYEMQKKRALAATTFEAFVYKLEQYNLSTFFERIAAAYDNIESREIWCDESLQCTLSQLEFMDNMGRFDNRGTLSELLDELQALLVDFQDLTVRGKKASGKKFDFCRRPFATGIGGMLVDTKDSKMVSIPLSPINMMTSKDPDMVKEFEYSFKAIINQSTVLGVGAEVDRTRFFNRLFDAILSVRKQLF